MKQQNEWLSTNGFICRRDLVVAIAISARGSTIYLAANNDEICPIDVDMHIASAIKNQLLPDIEDGD